MIYNRNVPHYRTVHAIEGRGKGSYVLILGLNEDKEINVGRKGTYYFQKGYYAYVGSAFGPGGVSARMKHHLKKAVRPHWHIDYLRLEALPREAWIVEQDVKMEHVLASKMCSMSGAFIPITGFGASDCKCRSHLFHFKKRPSIRAFGKLLCNIVQGDIKKVNLLLPPFLF